MLYKCTTFAPQKLKNALRMNTLSVRKQTSFRLNADLLERLQEEAKIRNRSLNNLVESILLTFVSKSSNKTSLQAMKGAETDETIETLKLNNFMNFVDS